MPAIVPNLWFDTQALDAAEFYVSIFPNSKVTNVVHYNEAGHRETGMVMVVDFELDGQPHTAINGGPEFTFDEAVSLLVDCKDQAEIDRYYAALLEGGGTESQCGWLKDRFGLSWQVCSNAQMYELFDDADPARAARATQAMFGMQKIDLAAMRAAADAE